MGDQRSPESQADLCFKTIEKPSHVGTVSGISYIGSDGQSGSRRLAAGIQPPGILF